MEEFSAVQPRQHAGHVGVDEGGGVQEGGEEGLGSFDPVAVVAAVAFGAGGVGQGVGSGHGLVPLFAAHDGRPAQRLHTGRDGSGGGGVPQPAPPDPGAAGDGGGQDVGFWWS
ncbi:MAG: hypothetical protein M3083_12250 [Actinomycetota bacterium]|nr:hypothetical protein [Actinomycetota bacterium]